MTGNVPIANSILLHEYSHVMSEGTFLDDTTTTRTIATAMMMTVMENKPMRASFFFVGMRRFHSKAMGTVRTTDCKFNKQLLQGAQRRLTQQIRSDIESAIHLEDHLLVVDFDCRSAEYCIC